MCSCWVRPRKIFKKKWKKNVCTFPFLSKLLKLTRKFCWKTRLELVKKTDISRTRKFHSFWAPWSLFTRVKNFLQIIFVENYPFFEFIEISKWIDKLKIGWWYWKYIWILYSLVILSTICKFSTFGKILMQNVNNLQKFADCKIFSTFSNACADCWHSATNLRKVDIRQLSTFGVTYNYTPDCGLSPLKFLRWGFQGWATSAIAVVGST